MKKLIIIILTILTMSCKNDMLDEGESCFDEFSEEFNSCAEFYNYTFKGMDVILVKSNLCNDFPEIVYTTDCEVYCYLTTGIGGSTNDTLCENFYEKATLNN